MLLGPTVTFGFAFRFDGVDYIVVCVTSIGTFLSNVKKKNKKQKKQCNRLHFYGATQISIEFVELYKT